MSDLDTRKAGSGQTASFAKVRLESLSLLPEQLVDRIKAAHDGARDVDVRIEEYGTGTASRWQPGRSAKNTRPPSSRGA